MPSARFPLPALSPAIPKRPYPSRLFVSTNPELGAFAAKIAEWLIPSAVL